MLTLTDIRYICLMVKPPITPAYKGIFLFCTLLLMVSSVRSQVFVKHDAIGANNGSSWQDAYKELDSAINHTASGQIWVAAGTYKPKIRVEGYGFKTFMLSKQIALFGGFAGYETQLSQRDVTHNITILSGDVGVEGYDDDNTPRVVSLQGNNVDSNTILDGFTITKCHYKDYQGYSYENGAVYIYSYGNPIVRNCIIRNNVGHTGGGIFAAGGDARIENNLITENSAYEGAGIFLGYGGREYVVGNRIINNKCIYGNGGGGIKVGSYCAPLIYGNLIDNNLSSSEGGGIAVESNYPVIINNNIISNNTGYEGAGLYIECPKITVMNNLITNNTGAGFVNSSYGGGIFARYVAEFNCINNTIVNNSATDGGGMFLIDANILVQNTIIYNNPTTNTSPIYCILNRLDWFPRFTFSAIQNGSSGIFLSNTSHINEIWLGGNISSDPSFVDTASVNYYLSAQSLLVDAGKPDTTGLSLPNVDVANRPRIENNRIDIGCYENNNLFPGLSEFSITPNYNLLSGEVDTTINAQLISTGAWNVSAVPEWMSVNVSTGTGNTPVSIFAPSNPPDNAVRQGKIIFMRPGIVPPVPVTIKQLPTIPYLQVSADTLYINSQENDSAQLTITTNGDSWSMFPSSIWLSPTAIGSGDSTVIMKASANPGPARLALLSIQGKYKGQFIGSSLLVRVIQRSTFFSICQDGSTILPSEKIGGSYKWQINTGSGFVDIVANDQYSEVNTQQLKFTNIPSSYYGFKYRCLVDDIPGNIYTLKVENNWTGTANNAWENPANWSCGLLPDEFTDVVITSGTVIVSANTTIRSLTVRNGASVTVSNGVNLTILH